MDPVTILNVLGSLASIISLVQPVLDKGTAVSAQDAEKIVATSREQGRVLASAATQDFLARLGESPIVGALGKKVKETEERVAEKLTAGGLSRAEEQTLIDQAKADVCAALRQMKSVNGGVLPSVWAEKWVAFQC